MSKQLKTKSVIKALSRFIWNSFVTNNELMALYLSEQNRFEVRNAVAYIQKKVNPAKSLKLVQFLERHNVAY